MNMVSSWLRRRAIIRYRKTLPYALAKDYGKAEAYLPAQVKATVDRSGLSQSYLVYALALYCTADEFKDYLVGNELVGNEIEPSYEIANDVVDNALHTANLGRKDNGLSVASPAGESGGAHGDGGADGGGGGGE